MGRGSLCAALRRPSGLANEPLAAHIEGMTSGTWTTERFECPKCGMWYRATKEHDPEPQPGRFICTECNTEILSWSGIDRYFDWQEITMRPRGGA